MQKAIIVKDDQFGEDTINNYLQSGWEVFQMCPMPSSRSGTSCCHTIPVCLVIIQKKDR